MNLKRRIKSSIWWVAYTETWIREQRLLSVKLMPRWTLPTKGKRQTQRLDRTKHRRLISCSLHPSAIFLQTLHRLPVHQATNSHLSLLTQAHSTKYFRSYHSNTLYLSPLRHTSLENSSPRRQRKLQNPTTSLRSSQAAVFHLGRPLMNSIPLTCLAGVVWRSWTWDNATQGWRPRRTLIGDGKRPRQS